MIAKSPNKFNRPIIGTHAMPINPSLILMLALTFALPAQAEVTLWFDADGNSHLIGSESDNPASIGNHNDLEVKSANKNHATIPQVDLYITSWCPY